MTTKITVDAHAGWDVEVLCRHYDSNDITGSVTLAVVPKHTTLDFYVHSNLDIISIREIRQPE